MLKKIIKSFLNLFLFSAILHNSILVFLAITKGNIKYLNYFRILGLEEFWPKIAEGKISDLLSLILILIIVVFFLLRELDILKLNNKNDKKRKFKQDF